MPITQQHVDHYREHGFAVVENFLTPGEVDGARADIEQIAPGWPAYVLDPTGPKPKDWDAPGSYEKFVRGYFPYSGSALNELTFHPELRKFASLQLGGAEAYCEQSHLSYKCRGSAGDADQHMHLDYSNHTIAYPSSKPQFWQTAFLMYFSDVTLESGPTAVCSKQHYPEKVLWPSHYGPEDRPALYDNEVKVCVPAGGLLMYSMRTFHRGTKIHGDVGRLGMFVTYAPANCNWLGIVGWAQHAGGKDFARWASDSTVEQRTALGFPPPGHEFWDDETIAGVAARFPGIDVSAYRDALD